MAKTKNRAFDHSKYQNWIDPNNVVPYEKNAKLHDDKQVKNIANSIKRFGWQQDTVITSDNVLVIGHGRRLAALEIGCEMPYHMIDKTADELTEDDIRELRIADNQTNAETGFDFDMLGEDIEGLDFEGFDFDFGIPDDDGTDFEPDEEQKGSLASRYLVPPFSVIYANKPDWLARKRAWVNMGIHSEIGRGGDLLTIQGAIQRQTSYTRGGQSGTKQSLQEQHQTELVSKKAKAYADGLIEKREAIRRGTYRGATVREQGGD